MTKSEANARRTRERPGSNGDAFVLADLAFACRHSDVRSIFDMLAHSHHIDHRSARQRQDDVCSVTFSPTATGENRDRDE